MLRGKQERKEDLHFLYHIGCQTQRLSLLYQFKEKKNYPEGWNTAIMVAFVPECQSRRLNGRIIWTVLCAAANSALRPAVPLASGAAIRSANIASNIYIGNNAPSTRWVFYILTTDFKTSTPLDWMNRFWWSSFNLIRDSCHLVP